MSAATSRRRLNSPVTADRQGDRNLSWSSLRSRSGTAARVLSVAALVVPIAQQEQGCGPPPDQPVSPPPAVQPSNPTAPGQLGQFYSSCNDSQASGTGAPFRFRAFVDATPGVTLTWDHEFGVNTPHSFRLERSDDGGRNWTLIGDRFAGSWKDGNGAHHRLPGQQDYQSYLNPGGTYFYRVGAYVAPSGTGAETLQWDCNVIGVRVR